MENNVDTKLLQLRSKNIRKNIVNASFKSQKSSHFGGSLSIVEILTTLYGSVLNYNTEKPGDENRDRFILSKGHGALGLFSTLYEFGLINEEQFYSYMQNGSEFIAHPICNVSCGIESSNGSLGHGLSMGVGISLAAQLKKSNYKTFVLMGDGECNEGSVWEAAMAGSNFNLGNLTAIIDRNNMQNDGDSNDIIKYHSIQNMWDSFGWHTEVIDGHNTNEIYNALTSTSINEKPRAIIANTIKGKGIPFMENVSMWHHGKLTEKLYQDALVALDN